jgi:hypothetical protein
MLERGGAGASRAAGENNAASLVGACGDRQADPRLLCAGAARPAGLQVRACQASSSDAEPGTGSQATMAARGKGVF